MPSEVGTLEDYLSELRARLRGLSGAEVDDIVAELRSHVRESGAPAREATEGEVTAVLARLGSPSALAASYLADRLLGAAERTRSPWRLLRGLSRWAALSAVGGFALCGVVFGYTLATSFFVAALAKLFRPDRAGLFRTAGGDQLSLRLGLSGSPAQPGEELLGWWIVPLGVLLGGMAYGLTVSFARWAIRRYRRRLPVTSS
jgi:hypothetical protein